jgi:hypothetical protein
MGVDTIEDRKKHMSVLYDTVSDTPFGRIFYGADDAEEFLDFLDDEDGRDARIIPEEELEKLINKFMDKKERMAEKKRKEVV